MSDPTSNQQLSDDIHLLGDVLGRVIRKQAGIAIYEMEERLRALTKVRRIDHDPAIDDAVMDRRAIGCSIGRIDCPRLHHLFRTGQSR